MNISSASSSSRYVSISEIPQPVLRDHLQKVAEDFKSGEIQELLKISSLPEEGLPKVVETPKSLDESFHALLAKLDEDLPPAAKDHLLSAMEMILKSTERRIKEFNEVLHEYNEDLEKQLEKTQKLAKQKEEELEELQKDLEKLQQLKQMVEAQDEIKGEKISYM